MIAAARQILLTIAASNLLAALCLAQPAEPAATKNTGTISGIVISGSGNLPAETVVYVSPVTGFVEPRSTIINSDGTFKIDNLDAGVYRVWANAPGFVTDPQQLTPGSPNVYHTGDSATLKLRKGGVITGTVLNQRNAPVVNAPIRAFRIADETGKPLETSFASGDRMTDDRGVYRMYGLAPGTYVVSAGGAPRGFGGFGGTAYDQEVPTFAPSSARDTALSIVVRSGEEATADIQYRGEPGHSISGTISGMPQGETMNYGGGAVSLTEVKTRTTTTSASTSPSNDYAFAFYGLADGEYELVASSYSQSRETRASAPKRIKVQGADISGVNLVVTALASISGRIILDSSAPADCVKRRATAFQETLVSIRRQKQTTKTNDPAESAATEPVPLSSLEQFSEAVPDAKGDFVLRNLRSGTFRINVQLPSPAWYLGSVKLGPNARGTDSRVISDGIGVRQQSISGLTITLNEGAAAVRGQLTIGEGQRLPERTIVYLVPAEKENAANLLRYFETSARSDGKFALSNVPPGEYLIVGLKADAERPAGILVRQDADFRTGITREAEKSKQTVTLKPCERIDDFELPFSVTPKP